METAAKNWFIYVIYAFSYLFRTLGNTQTLIFGNMAAGYETKIWPSCPLYIY